MNIVSAAEMRETDRLTSERLGVPSLTLMENAGSAVASFVFSDYRAGRIGLICGKGNNGGDGFVAARKLHEAGREVLVLLLADPADLRGDAATMFEKLPVKAVIASSPTDLKGEDARFVFECDVLVDAILGTGFHPPVQGLYAEVIHAMNDGSAAIVAVDIPSGADSDAMQPSSELRARADAIVTFTAPKLAHVFADLTGGPVVVAPIGSPAEAIVSSLGLSVTTAHDVAQLIGPRRPDSNKGNFGHVLVVGGSVGKSGAAAMAGMSALRAGAGLSTVATARSVLPTVASFHPELMTEPLDETDAGTISLRALEYGQFDRLVEGKTGLAIGPGISRNPETSEFVRIVVSKYQLPMVIDADGLNAFEGKTGLLGGKDRPLVLTPHPGEMARLTGLSTGEIQKDRLSAARTFARDHNLFLVLKGHRTLVAHPDGTVWVNPTGNPGMATGGTGDILTGIVAGMVAQFPDRVFEAVIAAVYLHGLAGDIAREDVGEQSLVATDLVKALPEAFRRTRKSSSVDFSAISGAQLDRK
jgi:ADP-dependent NAD(P)H-hydrate dehydratase / NAD(P)H-hydrate epimerase